MHRAHFALCGMETFEETIGLKNWRKQFFKMFEISARLRKIYPLPDRWKG